MSTDIKVRGVITISLEEKQNAKNSLEDYELAEIEPLNAIFEGSDERLVFDLQIHLANVMAFEFSEWLDDLMNAADGGQLYYWAENFEANTYVLLEVCGKESVLFGQFPESALIKT